MAFSDIFHRLIDSEYRKLVKYLESNIDIDLTSFSRISWNKIKKHIRKDVKSIKVNSSLDIKSDFNFFRTLKDLEKIDFGENSSLDEKSLEFFSALGIKELTVEDLLINYQNVNFDFLTVASNQGIYAFFNGMVVNIIHHNEIIDPSQVIIEGKLNDEVVSRLLSKLDMSNAKEIIINKDFENVNSYVINRDGNIVNRLEIESFDLTELERIYNLLLYKGFDIKEVSVVQKNATLNDVFKLMYLYSGSLGKINVRCTGENLLIKTNLENGKFKVYVQLESLSKVKELYDYLCKNEMRINELVINVSEYQDKYDEGFGMEFFRNISKVCDLKIEYSFYTCSYDEWKGLRESVRWYRKLITSYELSPVEKVMYTYDLMKTIPYTHPGQNGSLGRAPHSVMNTNYVVCVGFSNMFCEIINGLDSGIGAVGVDYKILNHKSVLVRIDDDKYDIHGIFELDPTADGKVVNEIQETFNFDAESSLDLYHAFLVSVSEHKRIFGDSELPTILKIFYSLTGKVKGNINDVEEEEVYLLFYLLKKLFGKAVSNDEVNSYLNVKRPSLSDFKSMLLVVRKAQGFSDEEALKEVERVVKFNIDYSRYINEQFNRPKEIKSTFFEDEVKRGR